MFENRFGNCIGVYLCERERERDECCFWNGFDFSQSLHVSRGLKDLGRWKHDSGCINCNVCI